MLTYADVCIEEQCCHKFPTRLEYLRHDPPEGKADNLLVLLHGLGDTPANYLTFGTNLQLPSTTVVSLRAPWPLGAGGAIEAAAAGHVEGYQWFPAFEDDGSLIKPPTLLYYCKSACCTSTIVQMLMT